MRVPVTVKVGLALVVVGGISASTALAFLGFHRVTKESMKTAKPPFAVSVDEKDGVVNVTVDIPKDGADWLGAIYLRKEEGKKTILSISIAATVRDNGSAVARLAVPREIADGAELSVFFNASDHGGDNYAILLGTFLSKRKDADDTTKDK